MHNFKFSLQRLSSNLFLFSCINQIKTNWDQDYQAHLCWGPMLPDRDYEGPKLPVTIFNIVHSVYLFMLYGQTLDDDFGV